MSDLQAKFEGFESQVATQHTEVINALNTIITALGAPPPGPTTTLADVVAAIEATNSILTSYLSDSNAYLSNIFNTLDTMNNNASLNAQWLIATIQQTTCPCETDVPLFPPDPSTTPTDATATALCQRIQYFLDLFASWCIQVGVYVSSSGSISSFQINNSLQITLLEIGISTGELRAGIPTTTRDSIAGAITGMVSASGPESVNIAMFDAMTDEGNIAAMRQALYTTVNAADGKAAFDSAVDSEIAGPIAGIIKKMFYSAWPNDIYSDVPIVDASGYDGTVCDPEGDLIVITESCGFLFTQVVAGNTASGNFSILTYTHLKFGVSGAGGGTVSFYVDDILRSEIVVIDTGTEVTWIGTGTYVRFVCATSLNVYVAIQACTGTYGYPE